MYLESTSKFLIQLLHEFRLEINETLNRLYEIYVILRRRYYNFEFLKEQVIIHELKALFKKSKMYQNVLVEAQAKFDETKRSRDDIIEFIESIVISKMSENKQRESLVEYTNEHKRQNGLFEDIMKICSNEIDIMKKTFIDYKYLVEYKEVNAFNHNLYSIN